LVYLLPEFAYILFILFVLHKEQKQNIAKIWDQANKTTETDYSQNLGASKPKASTEYSQNLEASKPKA
jgi:hypothetical protein